MSTALSPAAAVQLIAQLHADGALDGTLMVGGQAIQYWAGHFRIRPRLPSITRDVDLFGTQQQAQRAAARNSTARVEPLVPGELLTVRLPQMEAHVKAKRDALSRRHSAQARAAQRRS